MGWGKFDDRYPSNRKIRPLSDAGFRLDVSAILWCSENLTDGFVPRDELHLASDVKQPVKAAAELVRRGRWHLGGEGCGTETCPSGKPADGWQIHDYLDFNDTKEMVDARRAADRKRKRKPPVPDGTPPPGADKGPLDSRRIPAGIQGESAPESAPEGERSPNGVQPSALPRERTRAPAPRPVPSLTATTTDLGSGVTEGDARLLPLRTALEAVRLVVRWDKLDPTAADRIEWLADVHGVPALVAAAQRAWQRDNPPAFANAWLGAWDALPLPKPRLVVKVCPDHHLEQPCISCAADLKAAAR